MDTPMRCPALDELPPSGHRTGWPWTTESPRLPATMADGRPWPRISVVTASYNRASFIEETLRSVLLQGYPDLEYIVIDGGSTDSTVDILRRYSGWLASWVSEPDRGVSHAINKGFERSSGALLTFVNSDDLYLPGALRRFAEAHREAPDAVLLGDVENFYEDGRRSELVRQRNVTFRNLVDAWNGQAVWHAPGVCVPRALYLAVGGFDETFTYTNDREWLCRLTQRAPAACVGGPTSRFRIHLANKSADDVPEAFREIFRITQRYWDAIPGLDKRRARALQYLNMASLYLGHHPGYARFWNRGAGARWLVAAWRADPRIVGVPRFLALCRRVLLPARLLRSSPWRQRA